MTSERVLDTKDSDFLIRVLQRPSYGFGDEISYAEQGPYRPSKTEVLKEVWSNINILKTKKNWPGFLTVVGMSTLLIITVVYFRYFFSWTTMVLSYVYVFHIHSYIYETLVHRGAIHQSFKFKNRFLETFAHAFLILDIPPELHHIAHHVHHRYADKIHDPYNARMGAFCLWFSDFNHQKLSTTLSKEDYLRASKLVRSLITYRNSYEDYLKWGSISHPFFFWLENLVSWSLWGLIFYLIGGFSLATAIFAAYFLQAILLIRNLNFILHGRGQDRREAGRDFNRDDYSHNNRLCIFFLGQWHSNHHLLPRSARHGLLPFQFDPPFIIVRVLRSLGLVTAVHDQRLKEINLNFKPQTDAHQ